MSSFQVYLMLQCNELRYAANLVLLFSILGIVGFSIWSIAAEAEGWEKQAKDALRWRMISAYGLLIAAILLIVTPSKKTVCAMVTVPTIVNGEKLDPELADIYKLGMERIRDELDDL